MHGSTVVLVALLTSALTATGTTYLIERYDVFAEAPSQVATPSLVGLSVEDARTNAQALKLALLIEGREPSDEGDPGTVIRQSVEAGARVAEGSAVGIVVAEAPPTVPAVVGMPLEQARAALSKAGYEVSVGDAVAHDEVAEGSIVSQAPEAKAALKTGGTVTLQPSSGPAALKAPKLTGLSLKGARTKLEEQGLSAKVRWISRAETVTYVVLSQKPRAGESIEPRGTVEIVVNR